MKTLRNNELIEELTNVLSGQTLDAIFPPLLFTILNNMVSLNFAIIGALGVATMIGITRLLKQQKVLYAFTGWFGVVIAGSFALLADRKSVV